jgi:hypothetical protein
MSKTITRRSAVSMAGLAAAPFVRATNKSESNKVILGSGEYTYEATHDWGNLPPSIKYGNCHGIVEDSHGRMYVFHTVHKNSTASDAMVVFDSKGKFVQSWGSQFAGGAHGLHIQKEGREEFFYLCDTKRSLVVKTTLDGKEVMTLGYPKESESYRLDSDGKPLVKYIPTNIAVASNGDIYVGDGYGSSFVNQYDRNGKFIRTFGGKATNPSQVKDTGRLNSPHGIFIDARGGGEELVVADRSNNRLQYFSLDGKHLRFVQHVENWLPCHFHFYKKLMVVPDLGARVQLLDGTNSVVATLGDDSNTDWKKTRTMERASFSPGKFVCPHGACFNHKGDVFVAEWVEVGRVTKLRKV